MKIELTKTQLGEKTVAVNRIVLNQNKETMIIDGESFDMSKVFVAALKKEIDIQIKKIVNYKSHIITDSTGEV